MAESIDKVFTRLHRDIDVDLMRFYTYLGLRVKAHIQMLLREQGINATGTLSATLQVLLTQKANGILLQIISPLEYAHYVEEGTKPHFPPVMKIHEWILAKKVYPRDPRMGTLDLAYVIARSLAKKGVAGRKIFQLAMKGTTSLIERELAAYRP